MFMVIKRIMPLICAAILLASCAPVPQSPGGFIDQAATRHGGQVSGMGIKVFTSEEVLFANFYGYANEAEGLIVCSDTVFKWGSITKSLTWIAILQLMEQGEIDIHADIRTYIAAEFLPELKYPTTIDHLMTHSSGFVESDIFVYYHGFISRLDPRDINQSYTIIGYILRHMDMPQRLMPGESRGEYAHYNAVLASYIVERVSGISFYEYVHEHIFNRLGMNHTAILHDSSDNVWVMNQLSKQACYMSADRRVEVECFRLGAAYMIGGAASCLADFHKFARALMPNAGDHTLFDNYETLLKLHKLFEYEYAAFTDPENGIIALNGQMCHTSTMLLDTHRGINVIVMTNQENEGYFNRVSFLRDVAERFYGDR